MTHGAVSDVNNTSSPREHERTRWFIGFFFLSFCIELKYKTEEGNSLLKQIVSRHSIHRKQRWVSSDAIDRACEKNVPLASLDYLVNKVESKIGLDLNGDGRIGGPGIRSKIEQATHVDLNRDGIIGGHRPAPGGGKRSLNVWMKWFSSLFLYKGLVGKIERMTHIDINRDGYIGGRPGYYPSPQKKHWFSQDSHICISFEKLTFCIFLGRFVCKYSECYVCLSVSSCTLC